MTDSQERNDDPKDNEIEKAATAGGLPVAPSLGPLLEFTEMPQRRALLDARIFYISVLSMCVGAAASGVAWLLVRIIRVLTNVSFQGSFSAAPLTGPLIHPGLWVIFVPIAGAIVIGFMARYGSRAVAGHGIPEAMEQVLLNQSRIPPKMTFLKPLSAAISIGTGGPYGAEGPIIATGGALGSLVGQILSTTAEERKVLLSAGAAAGIAATFNAPIASVLLAVELLLFEFRPRSLVPVSLACVVAAAIHVLIEGGEPFFRFAPAQLTAPSQMAVVLYLLIGCLAGVGAVFLTRAVYATEHFFEQLPIHWMWHPAIGGAVVGIVGYFAPRTFGSGYFNINDLLCEHLTLSAILFLGIMKLLSWTISLGSGTAGGTLAPVFTIGGTLGAALGVLAHRFFPHAGVSVGMAALVGMVGIFAGASRAFMASVVFAIETTLQPIVILPALAGCTAAYMISCILMRHSIMTVKMEKHGLRVPAEYQADLLDQILIKEVSTKDVVVLKAHDTLASVRNWIASGAPGSDHQGFPVVTEQRVLVGVLTRRKLLDANEPGDQFIEQLIRRPASFVYADSSLREAGEHMVRHDIGRLPVIDRHTRLLVGFVTRGDLLQAHMRRRQEMQKLDPGHLAAVARAAS